MLQKAPIASASVASRSRGSLVVRAATTGQAMKITVVKPTEDMLKSRGVRSWPTWGCGVSKFPWSYAESETCYVLQGKVIVTPNGGEPVEINQGDMATFPAGMSCTWDVKAPIEKHYNFH